MEARNTEANLGIGLKPSVGREHHDIRRLEGVIRRKENPAVVTTASKIRVIGATNGKVPFKQIILEWLSHKHGAGFSLELSVFLHDPLDRGMVEIGIL